MTFLRHFLLVLAAALLPALASAAPDAQALLKASDAIRNADAPFALTTTLIDYRDGKEFDRSVLEVYSRADSRSGQFRSLLQFAAPARDAGKLMLKSGNELWFFDPASKASVRISPQQRLLGQAANGDVVTVNLNLDYQARLIGEETLQDGDRKERSAWKLELNARSRDVTYPRIEYWLDQGNSQPIKARFYSESGKLLKTAFYRRYQNTLGKLRPTETVIIDGLNPKWVTVMRFDNQRLRDIPESWLQRDYLPRFKPE